MLNKKFNIFIFLCSYKQYNFKFIKTIKLISLLSKNITNNYYDFIKYYISF